jgi:hypothetical protein
MELATVTCSEISTVLCGYNVCVVVAAAVVFSFCLTLLMPPDFGGASEKCQGEF